MQPPIAALLGVLVASLVYFLVGQSSSSMLAGSHRVTQTVEQTCEGGGAKSRPVQIEGTTLASQIVYLDENMRTNYQGEQCVQYTQPLPPVPTALTPVQLRDAMECWATKGEFKQDPKIFLDPNPFFADDRYDMCAMVSSMYKRRYEASIYWEPSPSCPLPYSHLSGRDLCRTMNGRSVLLVGDSLTVQYFETWQTQAQRMILMGGGAGADYILNTTDFTDPFYCRSFGDERTIIQFCQVELCAHTGFPTFRVTFVRNDRLSRVTSFVKTDGLSDYWQSPWVTHLKNNSIVIMSRGAHYVTTPEFTQEIQDTFAYLEENYLNETNHGRLVFYRAAPPGHAGCERYTNTWPAMVRQDPKSLPYHWGEFEGQNEIAKRLINEKYHPYITYLDVDYVTSRRYDSHCSNGDCLHYCRPGPMDFWFELAVNSIRIASQVVYEDEPLPEELAPPAPPALPTESAAQNATSEVKT